MLALASTRYNKQTNISRNTTKPICKIPDMCVSFLHRDVSIKLERYREDYRQSFLPKGS